MTGYRNLTLAILTLGSCTYLAALGITYGSDLAGLTAVIGSVGATAVGAMMARGYNKKVAADQ